MFPYMMDDPSQQPLSVELTNMTLWETFHGQTNEMIITKGGRRMFPVVKLRIRGLESRSIYSIELEFVQSSRSRMKFADGTWTNGSSNEESITSARWRHPESPNFGYHWMSSDVSFAKLKITNKTENKNCVALSSLYKYYIKIHILKLDDDIKNTEKIIKTSPFPVTEFVAVTSYQNSEVTQLKIQHNPFAKAFQQPRNFLTPSLNIPSNPSHVQETQDESDSSMLSQAHVSRMVTPGGEFSSCRPQIAGSPIPASHFPNPIYGFQDADLMRLRHQQQSVAMAIGTPTLDTRFEEFYPQYVHVTNEQPRNPTSPWSSCSRISATSPVSGHHSSAIAYSSGNSSFFHSPFVSFSSPRRTQQPESSVHQTALQSNIVNQWNPYFPHHMNLGNSSFPTPNSSPADSSGETKVRTPSTPMETNYAQNSSPLSVHETAWNTTPHSPNCTYQAKQSNDVKTFF